MCSICYETATEPPAPGGVRLCLHGGFGGNLGHYDSQLIGTQGRVGRSLGIFHRWEFFSDWTERGQHLLSELITYSGNVSVFQNWAQYRLSMQYISQMSVYGG